MTLRRLLSHTGGIGTPSFDGYRENEDLPSLLQILDGLPPANSDPHDLALLLIELQLSLRGASNRVLKRETVEMMMTRVVDGGMGLGVRLWDLNSQAYFGHDGENAGFISLLEGHRDAGVGMVAMTNGDNGTALVKRIVEAVAADQHWPGQ